MSGEGITQWLPGLVPGLMDFGSRDLLLLALAAAVAGTARGFSGFGGALIFVPLASTVIGPQRAAALLLIIDGLLTLGMVPDSWRRANRREVFTMAAGAMPAFLRARRCSPWRPPWWCAGSSVSSSCSCSPS